MQPKTAVFAAAKSIGRHLSTNPTKRLRGRRFDGSFATLMVGVIVTEVAISKQKVTNMKD